MAPSKRKLKSNLKVEAEDQSAINSISMEESHDSPPINPTPFSIIDSVQTVNPSLPVYTVPRSNLGQFDTFPRTYHHDQLPLHVPLPRQTFVGMGTGELIASSEMEVVSALSVIGSVDDVHVGHNLGSVPEDGGL
ncbi:hypothetical protein ABVK25_008964 [Lepraria finkii]|uniref:Uncharacterized protein n=1 Tax=Lepraria finkii TaxID=1340010 RepID=A0ABR4AYJ6_9LECA